MAAPKIVRRLPAGSRARVSTPVVPGATQPRRRPGAGTPDAAPLPVPKDQARRGPVVKAGALLDRLLDGVLSPAPSRWT